MAVEFISLNESAELVEPGQTLAFGGMTLYRRPVAFAKALIQRNTLPRDLTLLCFTAGFESDLLVGAGCVKAVRSCYFGLESFGFAPMFTAKAQRGEIHVIEETEASIIMGIRAALSGISHMPSSAWVGTDLPELRPDVKQINDPYSDETLMAFPAIHCDIAVIHGTEGDSHGNVKINNNLGIDLELIYLADTVVATVEQIVDSVTPTTDASVIPYPGVDYIVHAPNGASPSSCYPLYGVDGFEILRYVEACNAGKFQEYISEFDPQ